MYALITLTGLKNVFSEVFKGAIRGWNKSDIVLLHLLSKFTTIDRIYKINKQTRGFFSYFFNRKNNPLKDDVYEFQKNISDLIGRKFKEKLLKYYYENGFLDLNLVFIDGHVIAYFGEKAF